MRASSKLTSFLVVLTLASAARAQHEGDLADVLPAETFLYASISDLGDLIEIDEDGAIATLLRHDAVKQAFDEIYGSFDWLQDKDLMLALNLEPKDLAQLFGGRIVFAIPEVGIKESDVDTTSGAGVETSLSLDLPRGVAAFADFDGTREQLEELFDNIVTVWEEEDDVNQVTLLNDEFEGARIYQFEVEDLQGEIDDDEMLIGFRDGLLVLSDQRDTLEDLLDRLAHGVADEERLVDAPRYTETLDACGETDVLVYLNLGEVGPLLNEVILNQMEQFGDDLETFVSPDDLIETIGLDAFWSMFLGLRVDDDEAELTFGLTHEDRDHGLARLITYADGGVEIPTFFNPDFHSASVSCYDFTDAYLAVMDAVKKASPYGYNVLDTQLGMLEREFPIRDALLENCDGLLIDILGYPEASTAGPDDNPTQAYILRVKDAQTLAEAVDEFGEIYGEGEPTEFMNERIYEIPSHSLPFMMMMMVQGGNLSFAVVENYLVVAMGETKMVESVIAHVKNPGESITEDQVLMTAFDDLPDDDVVSIAFADVSDLLLDLLRGSQDMIEIQMATSRDAAEREALRGANDAIEQLPDVSDIDYFIVSKTYRTPETVVQRALMRRGR